MENNSCFSGIEPLSVPQGIFVVFLLYLTQQPCTYIFLLVLSWELCDNRNSVNYGEGLSHGYGYSSNYSNLTVLGSICVPFLFLTSKTHVWYKSAHKMCPPLLRANLPRCPETWGQARILYLPSPELFKNGIPFKGQGSPKIKPK